MLCVKFGIKLCIDWIMDEHGSTLRQIGERCQTSILATKIQSALVNYSDYTSWASLKSLVCAKICAVIVVCYLVLFKPCVLGEY